MVRACRSVQQATAVSLAQLAPTGPELKSIFVEKPGLDILCDLVTDETATASEFLACHSQQVNLLHIPLLPECTLKLVVVLYCWTVSWGSVDDMPCFARRSTASGAGLQQNSRRLCALETKVNAHLCFVLCFPCCLFPWLQSC